MMSFLLVAAFAAISSPAQLTGAVNKAASFVLAMSQQPKMHEEVLVSQAPSFIIPAKIPVGDVATIPQRTAKTETSSKTPPDTFSELTIPAASAIALDRDSDAVLFEKNKDTHASIGSTTKMMTAIVVLESGVKLDDVVTISDNAAHTQGSTMGAQTGDQLTVKDVLYGLLIPSGNDAATALAEFTTNGHVDEFVARMNEKATMLGLHNTHFANPSGLDQTGNYSSAYDLAQLMDYALRYEFFQQVFQIKEYTAHVLNKPETRFFTATDELVGKRADVIGGKTGFTYQAGYCFIGVSQQNNHQLITVVLNAKDRFGETEQIIDWIFEYYQWSI